MNLANIILKVQTDHVEVGDVRKTPSGAEYRLIENIGCGFKVRIIEDGMILNWLTELIGGDPLVSKGALTRQKV